MTFLIAALMLICIGTNIAVIVMLNRVLQKWRSVDMRMEHVRRQLKALRGIG